MRRIAPLVTLLLLGAALSAAVDEAAIRGRIDAALPTLRPVLDTIADVTVLGGDARAVRLRLGNRLEELGPGVSLRFDIGADGRGPVLPGVSVPAGVTVELTGLPWRDAAGELSGTVVLKTRRGPEEVAAGFVLVLDGFLLRDEGGRERRVAIAFAAPAD